MFIKHLWFQDCSVQKLIVDHRCRRRKHLQKRCVSEDWWRQFGKRCFPIMMFLWEATWKEKWFWKQPIENIFAHVDWSTTERELAKLTNFFVFCFNKKQFKTNDSHVIIIHRNSYIYFRLLLDFMIRILEEFYILYNFLYFI